MPFFLGRSSSADSAGDSVSALKAEMITDTAMVTANCWYSRPVMPGMNAVGMNTADRMMAMAMTGPETSSMPLSAASLGDKPLLDVVLHDLDDHDGVVHHQADGQHQAEERQRVDGEAEQREQRERADQRHRHRQQRDERRAPALQEDEHHDDDEHDGLDQSVLDFLHALGHRQRRVERDHVIHVRREALLQFRHERLGVVGGVARHWNPGNW